MGNCGTTCLLEFIRNKVAFIFSSGVCARGHGGCVSHRPQPLPNLRRTLWCCGAHLSQSESASRLPVHVPLSLGCVRAPGYAVSLPAIMRRCAAFFRLPGLAHGRFIALKAGVLIQDGGPGIAERLVIGNLLVVGLPGVGLTQIPYPLGLGIYHHHILVTVGLMFATVVQGLFFWALRALTTAVRPINDQCHRLSFAAFMMSKFAGPAFRH